jgi:hypothetical protein
MVKRGRRPAEGRKRDAGRRFAPEEMAAGFRLITAAHDPGAVA